MIISTSPTNFKNQNSNSPFLKRIGKNSVLKSLDKSTVRNRSVIILSMSLAACQDTTITNEPLDSEFTGNDPTTSITTIEMPAEQVPVSGTLTSDTFVANSGFLTKATIIDGGDGTDTLNLNLKNSIKNSPTIKNIENLSLSSFGDYSLDLSNVSDLQYILSDESLGTITINGLSDPSIIFGFSGNGINSTILTNNDLGGTSDVLNIRLNDASDVSFQAPLGYEELEIELNGSSSMNYLIASGASTATIKGVGDLILGFDFAGLDYFSSENLDGKIHGNTMDSQGFSTNGFTGSRLGTALSLGPDSDNFHFRDKADSGSLNTLRLGSGNDKLTINLAPNSKNSIFGQQGNDEIKLVGNKVSQDELFDGGLGTDTVIIDQGHNNFFNFSSIESIILKNSASGNNIIADIDGPLSVLLETGKNNIPSDFSVIDLPSASNITISNALGETVGLGAFLTSYKQLEAIDTINVNSKKAHGDIHINNIGIVNLNFKESVLASNNDFKFDLATKVNIAAEENFIIRDFIADLSPAIDTLKELSINGNGTVSINSTKNTGKLETIDILSKDDLSINNLGSGALSSISLESQNGDLTVGHVDASNSETITTINLISNGLISNGSGQASIIESSTGSINAFLSGSSTSSPTTGTKINFIVSTPDVGTINLTTTRTSGLISTIENAGAQNTNQDSTIILGNAEDTKSNNVTLSGIVDNLNVTGGTGEDNIEFGNSNKIKSLNLNLGTGSDKVDFSNIQNANGTLTNTGLAINLNESHYNVLTGASIQPALIVEVGNESDVIASSAMAEFIPESDPGKNLSGNKFSGNLFGVEWIVGTQQSDYLIANSLGSKFNGGSGNDIIIGAINDDELNGDNGDDDINAKSGNDTLSGGAGNDNLTGGDGTDSLTGGAGNDTYNFNTGDVDTGESITEASSGGTDTISVITSTDFVNMSNASFDEIEAINFAGASQTATFTGAQLTAETLILTETVAGTSGLVINVGSGESADFTNITASTFDSGSDTLRISGSTGGETITGPNIAATISGNAGNDNITGGSAADIINGGNGNDTIDGNDGADTLTGGSGDDIYIFNSNDVDAGETIVEASSGGTDTISVASSTNFSAMSNTSFDEIEVVQFAGSGLTATFNSGQLGDETIELQELVTGTSNLIVIVDTISETVSFANISASSFTSGSDTFVVQGSSGSDTITAPNIASTLYGNDGTDTLIGGSQADIINGGDGADALTGNGGADTFQWNGNNQNSGLTTSTADTVTDFLSGTDKINFGVAGNATANSGNYVEASSSVGSLNAAHSAANAALAALNGTSSASELYAFQYDGTNGYLFRDKNSDGVADGMFILTGIDHTEIAASDII